MYYLHDKGANTSDRVAFVDVQNMPKGSAERPERAFAHMIHTAEHANDLKRAAGLKAGRKMKDPVYSYSLSWHPSESPTRADMMDAAKETLAALGMANRQAVFIAHNDTEHPHIHVIVNRVCHETGRAHTMSKDRLILSDWALAYRKERGEEHFCPERAENKAKREQGNWAKHKPDSRRDWHELKKAQSDKLWKDFRAQQAVLKGDRRKQSDALWRQRGKRVDARKREIKSSFKPMWRNMYKAHSKELKAFDAGVIGRINAALTMERHRFMGAIFAIIDGNFVREELLNRQAFEKKQLSNHQYQAVCGFTRDITATWKSERDQMVTSWKAQDEKRYGKARVQSSKIWEKAQTADDKQAEPIKEKKPNAARRSRSRPRGGRGRSFTPD